MRSDCALGGGGTAAALTQTSASLRIVDEVVLLCSSQARLTERSRFCSYRTEAPHSLQQEFSVQLRLLIFMLVLLLCLLVGRLFNHIAAAVSLSSFSWEGPPSLGLKVRPFLWSGVRRCGVE